jgi:site-specific DNA-methyltransferase (adenine-specific)
MGKVTDRERAIDTLQRLYDYSCPEGGVVLDPFLGSGTTLLAARQEGRRGVGIEINPKYCDVAIERLRQKTLF